MAHCDFANSTNIDQRGPVQTWNQQVVTLNFPVSEKRSFWRTAPASVVFAISTEDVTFSRKIERKTMQLDEGRTSESPRTLVLFTGAVLYKKISLNYQWDYE